MAHFFRAPDRRQRFLLPVDMMEWLPEDDIVHLMVDAVGLMDLSRFEATCKVGGAGQPPFAPAMLLALCREAGLIRLGLVALDGTKVKANAALDANRTASTIEEQVGRMLAEAEATDAREDRQFGAGAGGPAMPKGLSRHADRLARLQACREKLEARAAALAARQQEKIAAREAEEKASGKRKRGRKPKEPAPRVDPDTVANPTDPDSGIMKTRRGWVQGYNAQAVV